MFHLQQPRSLGNYTCTYMYLQVFPDLFCQRELDDLQVLCENCEWTGKLGDLEVMLRPGLLLVVLVDQCLL